MYIFSTLPCVGAVVWAGYLAAHSLDGWGWFLLTALLIMPSYKSDDDNNHVKEG
jgi:hypothetical protein